MQLFKVASQL